MIKDNTKKYEFIFLITLISFTAWFISYRLGLITTYNDAMSHLDISRLVIDNKQPGIAQLGSVWLPLNQIAYLPLIWIKWAWHSGFAGSIVSMLSYVASVIATYFIVLEISEKKLAAYVGGTVVALNMNFLYLQSTPLTEPLFLALLILTSLFLIKYLKTHDMKFLILTSLFTTLQVSARYDGWFMAAAEAAIIIYYEIAIRKLTIKKVFGILALFLTPILFVMALWFLWNYILFGSFLYAFIGPYSAHAQQQIIQSHNGLLTKYNLWQSFRVFALDSRDNIGTIVSFIGLLGWFIYLFFDKNKTWLKNVLFALFISDAIFNILALLLGFSILNIPEIHWNPSHSLAGEYFNVRYGITTLPFIAVGVGLLASKIKKYSYIIILLVILQGALLLHSGLITVLDGTIGSSSNVNQDTAMQLKKDAKPGQTVLIADSSFNTVMFQSGLNLSSFIHEGVSSEWSSALANPFPYAEWIVMSNGNTGDPVYNSLVLKEKNAFLVSYKLVYSGHHANLYERKTPFQQFISIAANHLTDGGNSFTIKGVNSYDLAYQSKQQIKNTFIILGKAKVNTIRFWLFGDGVPSGFQPQAGVLNNQMLQKSDYIFAEANIYHIRLVPVLVNNWSGYGGMNQYVSWVGLPPNNHDAFFTNSKIVNLYKNYINHILTRNNSITHTSYLNDPSVLAWDIANEPNVTNPRDISGISTWVNEISGYVKTIDPNHLVTVSLDNLVLSQQEQQICGSKYVSFCSAHLLLTTSDGLKPLFNSFSDEQAAIQSYQNAARAIRKPLIMSEVGIAKNTLPYGIPPLSILNQSLNTITTDGYAGWLIWNWELYPDNTYGFSPTGNNGIFNLNNLQGLFGN